MIKITAGSRSHRILSACFSFCTFAFCLSPFAFCLQKTEEKTALATANFPKFVEEYILDLHSRHPSLAATSGIHAWDGQLEDFSSEAILAEIIAIKKFQFVFT